MKKFFAPVLLSVIFCSCGNFVAGMKEIMALNDQLKNRFKCEAKVTATNSDFVGVALINSRFNDSSDVVKQTIADTIGAMCMRSLAKIKIADGTVSFVRQTDHAIVHTSSYTSFPMNIKK